MNQKVKSSSYMLLCAIIWGTAFVAQRTGMDGIGPIYFNAMRMIIGGLVLIPIAFFSEKATIKERVKLGLPKKTYEETALEKKTVIKGGLCCGFILFMAVTLQQIGIVSTSAGKTAFITTLYIVLVPIFGMFIKHKTNLNNWLGVGLALIGLYFLCIQESLTISYGDGIILIGAIFWALHILFTDHFAPKVNVSKLVCAQSFVGAAISLVLALFIEEISLEGLMKALPSLLYVGVMSTGFAFTFQALGQKHANPTVASIILSTESLFAAVSGYFILGEVFTTKELIGCILLFTAVIIAQLPTKKERMNNKILKKMED